MTMIPVNTHLDNIDPNNHINRLRKDKFRGESGKYTCDLYFRETDTWETRDVWLFKGEPVPEHVRGYYPTPVELFKDSKTPGEDWTDETAVNFAAAIVTRAIKDLKSEKYHDGADHFLRSDWCYEMTGKRRDELVVKKLKHKKTSDILKKDHRDFNARLKEFKKVNGYV